MPRTLARCLLSAALMLAVVVSSRRADAKPTKEGDCTARELAAQSRPTAKAVPPARPHAKAKAAPQKAGAPAAKPSAHGKAKASAKAKPRPDQKIKTSDGPKTKSPVKPVPVRPSAAPPAPGPKTTLARA